MRKFISGVAVGVFISAAVPVVAAEMVGGHGYLMGWDVKVKGKKVCSDPWIWTGGLKEIEC